MNNKFEVRSPKSDLILFLVVMSCILAMFIIGFVLFDTLNLKIIFAVCAVAIIAVVIAYSVATYFYSFKVENDIFRIRTNSGKRYEFNVSEIQSIRCIKRDSLKNSPRYLIAIVTKAEEFEVHYTMVGFETLAAYIVYKFDCGVLSKQVISRDCYYKLLNYKDRNFTGKIKT